MNFWKRMALIWMLTAGIVGVAYVQEPEMKEFYELAFLLLQGLIAWGISNRNGERSGPFWKVMSALWLVAALVIGVEYVQEAKAIRFIEFALTLLQGLVAWGISKRDQEKG